MSKFVIEVRGVHIQPYSIGDYAYPNWPYLLKNFKPWNPAFVDQISFDSFVNSGRVAIEQAFGDLKNRWRIL